MSTLKEVAKLCGVTPATVSYVLNGKHLDRMLPETIQKVRAAAKKLNYRPHASARSLVTGRTETIGVYCPGHLDDVWQDSYLVDVLRGIFYESALAGYAVQVTTDDVLKEDHRPRQPAVDGWISVMSRTPAPAILGDPVNIIYLDPFRNFSGTRCFWGNNEQAGRIAGEYCAGHGWKTAFVLHESLKESPVSYQDRWSGVKAGFGSRKKLLQADPWVLPLEDSGKKAPLYDLIHHGKLDAVIATSDLLSCKILRDCRKLGVAIPGAMRLIGIDNLLQSRMVSPAVTTVDVAALELGRQATRSILQLLQNKKAEFDAPVPRLIERETT